MTSPRPAAMKRHNLLAIMQEANAKLAEAEDTRETRLYKAVVTELAHSLNKLDDYTGGADALRAPLPTVDSVAILNGSHS